MMDVLTIVKSKNTINALIHHLVNVNYFWTFILFNIATHKNSKVKIKEKWYLSSCQNLLVYKIWIGVRFFVLIQIKLL
jgi:hypothetical protein